MKDDKFLSDRIRVLRTAMKMSQAQFGVELGRSLPMIHRYEKLKAPTDRRTLALLVVLACRYAPELAADLIQAYLGDKSPEEGLAEEAILRHQGVDPEAIDRYHKFLRHAQHADIKAVQQIIDRALEAEDAAETESRAEFKEELRELRE